MVSVEKQNVIRFTKLRDGLALVIMVAMILLSSLLASSFSVFAFHLLLFSLTLGFVQLTNKQHVFVYAIILAVSLSFVLLVYQGNQQAYGVPYFNAGSDDLYFEINGHLVAKAGFLAPSKLLGTVLNVYDDASFFAVILSLLVRFSEFFDGYSTFLPRILNAYSLVWILMIIEYLLDKHGGFSLEALRMTLLVVGLSPNIQYINAHIFRDTVNFLQVLMIVLVFDKVVSSRNLRVAYLAMLVPLVYMTFYTRANSLVFAAGLCLIISNEWLGVKKRYLLLGLAGLVLFSGFLEKIRFYTYISIYSDYLSGGGLSDYVFRVPVLPFGVVLRAAYALISPLPLFSNLFMEPQRTILDILRTLTNLGVIIRIVFIPFIVKRVFKFDWLSMSFLCCFLGVIMTTFTFRHVLFYFSFMVALGVDGYLGSTKKVRALLLLVGMFLPLILGLLYSLLK